MQRRDFIKRAMAVVGLGALTAASTPVEETSAVSTRTDAPIYGMPYYAEGVGYMEMGVYGQSATRFEVRRMDGVTFSALQTFDVSGMRQLLPDESGELVPE